MMYCSKIIEYYIAALVKKNGTFNYFKAPHFILIILSHKIYLLSIPSFVLSDTNIKLGYFHNLLLLLITQHLYV